MSSLDPDRGVHGVEPQTVRAEPRRGKAGHSPAAAAAEAQALGGTLRRGAHAARSAWRRSVKGQWHDVRPAVLLSLGIVVLVLGTIGFEQYSTPGPSGQLVHPYGLLDSVYRAITLFAFGGAVAPPVPLTLQIARILAPVLTGYAAVGTIIALSREQARVLGIRLFVRNHVIVAGLGATGSRLSLSLVEKEPVVVIETAADNEHLSAARARGVRVLLGEANDEILLRRAGIEHARKLVISCGSDGTNVNVAAAAARILDRRRQPLTIFVHLNDVDLWSSLALEGATFGSAPAGLRLEYFNVLATGAQLLLERHPAFEAESADGGPERPPHVLIVGLEGVGEQLVLQLARTWRSLERGSTDRLALTLAGPDAEADLVRLSKRYPSLECYCVLAARPGAIESASFQAGAAMVGEDGRCDVTRAYVSITDPADALIAALALHARYDAAAVPVIVALADSTAGIGIVLDAEHGRLARIRPFGVLSAATSDELLLRGTNELFARAQHAQWLRAQEAKNITFERKPTMRPWEKLDEAQREVNRRFADDIQRKLALVGCMVVPMPLRHADEPRFAFSPAELEQLSEAEHERWVNDKLQNGWRYGPKRDDAKKIHDQIKPWAKLDEENRQWDRDAVRELPGTLELAGFKIQKIGETGRGKS